MVVEGGGLTVPYELQHGNIHGCVTRGLVQSWLAHKAHYEVHTQHGVTFMSCV